MNEVRIKGRLVRQPKLVITKNGYRLCRFLLRVPRVRSGFDYIPCKAWNEKAEEISMLMESRTILIEQGRLEVGCWEKDGTKEWKMEVVADNIQYPKEEPSPFDDMEEEDIPF